MAWYIRAHQSRKNKAKGIAASHKLQAQSNCIG